MISTLVRLARANKNIVLLNTESISAKHCEEFARFFPDRSFSFGLAETNMISAAAGFALAGKLPIVVGSAEFLVERAFEQIKKDIYMSNLNVKLVGFGENEFNSRLLATLDDFKVVVGEIDCLDEMLNQYGPAYLEVKS